MDVDGLEETSNHMIIAYCKTCSPKIPVSTDVSGVEKHLAGADTHTNFGLITVDDTVRNEGESDENYLVRLTGLFGSQYT